MPRVLVDVALAHDAPCDPGALRAAAARALAVAEDHVTGTQITRKALDARRRNNEPIWRLTVEVDCSVAVDRSRGRPLPPPPARLASPRAPAGAGPVVVVGAGPAGLFAAWHLAEHGATVTLLERGKPVETRARDCGLFRSKGVLDPESNLAFGEGGAGTFSDGKLTTRKRTPVVREVLERLVEVGAPPAILIDAKPHIGTNVLFRVLKLLRARLIELGVTVRFETRMERLVLTESGVGALTTTGGTLDAERAVLAIGHSARDTFEVLLAQGVPMIPKPFAVGLRAEHPQALIDERQYRRGPQRPATLPAADYRLTHEHDGRGVYSFCMCPGGMVVPTATEPNMVVVNGMSSARRSTPFANSGVVAQVELEDLARTVGDVGPLVGVEFQRLLERAAFAAGGGDYFAPAIRADDFVRGRPSAALADTHFRPGLRAADMRDVLPDFLIEPLQAALTGFDRKLRGYASSVANLIAVESRTSSPLRIPRDPETFEVPGFGGLFVTGEGPGYAGGIVSAAADGLEVAQRVLRSMELAPR